MSVAAHSSTAAAPISWPSDGGEMGGRLRGFDWSQHPLGPPETWPQRLKTTLEFMLASPEAMWMGWGAELWFFCNDAHLKALGIQESKTLGAPAREVWAEHWAEVGPIAESVMETGKAALDEGQMFLVERGGFPTEAYLTCSYRPVLNGDGRAEGVLCLVTEETDRRIGERRLALLHLLSSNLAGVTSAESLFHSAQQCLETEPKDLPLALLYLFDSERRTATLASANGAEKGSSIAPEVLRVDQPNQPWPIQKICDGDDPVFVEELDALYSKDDSGTTKWQPGRATVAPIRQQGNEQLIGFLVVGLNPFRPYDPEYRKFIDLLAAQIGAALSSIRAHEHEKQRDRAAAHATVLSGLTQRLVVLSDPLEIVRVACQEVGPYLQVDRCFFTETSGSHEDVRVVEDWSRDGVAKLSGDYKSADFASADLLSTASPFTFAVSDVRTHPYTQSVSGNFDRLGIRSFAVAPFARGDGPISNIMVTSASPREWRPDEIEFLENAVIRVRPLVDQARAVQAVRDNAARLRLALSASQMGDWSWDVGSDQVMLSAAAAAIFGAPREQKIPRKDVAAKINPEDLARVLVVVEKAVREGTEYSIEYRVQIPGRELLWVSSRGRPVLDANGRVTSMLGVVQDITARKLDEEARQKLAAIVESSDDAIISKTLEGTITSWNGGAERIYGYTEAEMLGKPIALIVPPDRREEEASIIDRIRRGDRIDHFETVRMRKDGSHVNVSVTISPLRDSEGKVVGASKIARDVSSHKHAEAQLRASEARWRQLAEAMPHLVWISGPDGSCEFISPQWCAYTGQTQLHCRDDLAWTEAIHPEDRKAFELAWNESAHARGILDMELRIRRSDGSYRWFKSRVVPVMDSVGNILKWYGSNTDIEDVRRTDLALRENESRLSALFAQAGAGIIQTDLEGRIVMVNDAYCEIVARPRADVLGMRIHDLTHPEDRQLHQAPFEDMMRGGPAFVIEKRDLRLDGSAVWVRNSVVGIRDSKGHVTAGLTIAQDITDSREAEDAMRASEEQLRLVTDHAPVLLAQFDRSHRYKFVNQPYAQQYACEPADMIGRHVADIIGSVAYGELKTKMEPASQGQRVEFESSDEAGLKWWNVICVPERTPEGEVVGIVTVLTDITRRKEEERELEQARDRALAAVRAKDEFLARLSHELRTPLSPVLLLASEGAANHQIAESTRQDFEIIRKNVDLEARLIDDLLDLTRITRGKLSLDLGDLDIHAVLNDAIGTIRSELAQKDIILTMSLEAEMSRVTGDAVRLQQVFWNLLNNAVKFSQSGGSIDVRTRLNEAQNTVIIDVVDSGIGMTTEELQRIFDAFSQGDHAGTSGSTRFGGLGLGLAISRMLVELHGGQIHAASSGRGQGATFTVELPLLVGAALQRFQPEDTQPTGPLPPRPPASLRSGLRILLVEDHEPTRTALSALLGRRKHQVKSADCVTAARRFLGEDEFDLLISDIGLPDGTGYDLMNEVRQAGNIRGIALSGYGMEHDVSRSREAGFSNHLIKPVRMEALDAAIAEAMGS